MAHATETTSSSHEDPFDLIARGNALDSAGNYWGSADAWGQAALLLRRLASSCTIQSEEHARVANLYREQSREYTFRARDALLTALAFENDQDFKRTKLPPPPKNKPNETQQDSSSMQVDLSLEPLTTMISPEEGRRRTRIFQQLFTLIADETEEKEPEPASPPEALNDDDKNVEKDGPKIPISEKHDEQDDVEDKTSDLEERLAQLEASLPPAAKTEPQRMADIQKGLARLGLFLPSSDNVNKLKAERIPSVEEQIELIMEQAKDEAVMYPSMNTEDTDQRDDSRVTETDAEPVEQTESVSELLSKVGINASELEKEVKREMSSGLQSSDSEAGGAALVLKSIMIAQGFLMEANTCIESNVDNEEESSVDDDDSGDMDFEVPSSSIDREQKTRERGKIALVQAQKCIEQAIQNWK
mmetsp:Transcript_4584/g.8144  ORF Transcript_4584/g.8144 Transcript_4584/m.8144 type:complete len:416 (-) Transcript_4584:83-1330(-)